MEDARERNNGDHAADQGQNAVQYLRGRSVLSGTELGNDDKEPFEGGWIIKISIQNTEEVDGLMSAAEYKEFIGK